MPEVTGPRAVVRVLPAEGGWRITLDAPGVARQPIDVGHASTKEAAEDLARTLARGRLTLGLRSQVVVHNRDGRFETEWTYPDETPERES